MPIYMSLITTSYLAIFSRADVPDWNLLFSVGLEMSPENEECDFEFSINKGGY
jgi:hypothetical protein